MKRLAALGALALALFYAVASPAQQTRAALNNYNNTFITANGRGAITGPILNSLLNLMISGTGVLGDTNVWTGTNTLNPIFTGTGGVSSSTLADSSTYKGVRLDARANFGMACNGIADDSAAYTIMVAQLRLTTATTTITFPGKCGITWGSYANITTPNLTFEGVAGGGITVAAGQTAVGNLVTFVGSGDVTLRNFTLDLNNAAPSGLAQAIAFQNAGNALMENSVVLNGAAPTTGNALLEVAMYGATSCQFLNNRFYFTSSIANQNQSLNFGSAGHLVSHCLIQGNYSKNSGFIIAKVGDDVTVTENEVDGFGFGAGIAIGDPSDHAYKKVVLSNNVIHDALSGRDINNTPLHGIEDWIQGSVVEGNRIDTTCGSSVTIGQQTTVIGNSFSNYGTCTTSLGDQSAISVATASGSTADGSFISGNKAFDSGAGTSLYGYTDLGSITNITLGVNDFNGLSGAYNIVGGTQFSAPQLDNRIVNPCMAINQRNEATTGFTANGTWVADQWKLTQSHAYITASDQTNGNFINCPNSLQALVSSSQTPAAGDFLFFAQNILLNDVLDFEYSTAQAQSSVLSFCTIANISPPFTGSVALTNQNASWSYVVNYTISAAANKRQCFSFRIPSDTHSLGNVGTNKAFQVVFDLGTGTTNKTSTIGAWVTGLFDGSTTASNFVSQANNSTIQFSNVRLLPAPADEGWYAPIRDAQLFNAQRFYRKSFPQGTAPAQSAGLTGATCTLNPIANGEPYANVSWQGMVGSPAITTFNPSAANANWRDTTASADVTVSVPANGTGVNGVLIGTGATVTTLGDLLCIHWTADKGT